MTEQEIRNRMKEFDKERNREEIEHGMKCCIEVDFYVR